MYVLKKLQFHGKSPDLTFILTKKEFTPQLYLCSKISILSTIPEMFYQGPWYELEYIQDLYPQTSLFWLTVWYFPTWILFQISANVQQIIL